MTDHSVELGSFTIEKSLKSPPGKVYAAFGDESVRRKLFGVDESKGAKYSLDFSLGGHEHNVGPGPGGKEFVYDAEFRDLVPDARIVYSYEMLMGGERLSVSVAAIELTPEGEGTKLVLTETGLYFDGLDKSDQREAGTNFLINTIADLIDQ